MGLDDRSAGQRVRTGPRSISAGCVVSQMVTGRRQRRRAQKAKAPPPPEVGAVVLVLQQYEVPQHGTPRYWETKTRRCFIPCTVHFVRRRGTWQVDSEGGGRLDLEPNGTDGTDYYRGRLWVPIVRTRDGVRWATPDDRELFTLDANPTGRSAWSERCTT